MMIANRKSGAYRVAVFCSANSKLHPEFFEAAANFSQNLARRGWELIYGGAQVGLMGCFADEQIKAGGVARGAITEGLARTQETPHRGLNELVVVKNLFERKRWMMEEADAFVIFPGGLGTLDEALEVITWKSLNELDKPILFVNLRDFWQTQLNTFNGFAAHGMIRAGGLELFEVCARGEQIWKILDDAEQALHEARPQRSKSSNSASR